MKYKINKKGFTLLEVLLVIATIGILAAIVLVAINPNRQIAQARNAERISEVSTLYKALEQYLIDNEDYPAGIDNTSRDICVNGNTTNCVNLGEGILVPNYLAAIPVDPQGGAYRVSKNSLNNRISVTAPSAELGQTIVINPGVDELIQAQIAAGTLVPTATQQLVLGRLVYKNNAGTQTYIDPATTTKTCPSGYIPVPGNSMYGVADFCVMKYEATTGSNTVAATTQAAGYPVTNITQSEAVTACSLNGAGYSLINNAEWMTMARNLEGQLSNWTTGTAASTAIGTGGLYRGHSDWNPSDFLGAGTDNDPYNGTGNSGFSAEKRTHFLSNGEVIWDLSGNVAEWTNNTITGSNKPRNSSGDPSFQSWQEWPSVDNLGSLSYDLLKPSNSSWNNSNNVGSYIASGLTGGTSVFARGSSVMNIIYSGGGGVFSLNLQYDSQSGVGDTGFRCIMR